MNSIALLQLLQMFDSQFPVGAFAHSGGLETYAAAGARVDELREVLQAQISLGWGRGELAAACLAWRAADLAALEALARTVDAYKVVPATRDASVRLGRRTLALLQRLHPASCGSIAIELPHHAVVVGAAGRRLDIDLKSVLLAFAEHLACGLVTAATRCMPVSPAQAQRLLTDVQPALCEAVALTEDAPEQRLFTSTPAIDIRAHQQTLLRTRLFQS